MEVVNIQVTEREHKEYQQTQKMLKIIDELKEVSQKIKEHFHEPKKNRKYNSDILFSKQHLHIFSIMEMIFHHQNYLLRDIMKDGKVNTTNRRSK